MPFPPGLAECDLSMSFHSFDHLVLTASSREQAAAFERELRLRHQVGWLEGIAQWQVVPDPQGRRIGSGGSTLHSITEVIRTGRPGHCAEGDFASIYRNDLANRRVLIIHAGGDSRRLPACNVSGKCFLPLRASGSGPLPVTVFDRLLTQLVSAFPPERAAVGASCGCIVVASGDVWLDLACSEIDFQQTGVTGVACPAPPDLARHHGVYLPDSEGRVRQFLQKPSLERQKQSGALTAAGQSFLDIGVVHFHPSVVERLLKTFGGQWRGDDADSTGELGAALDRYGLDLYRELLCAWGQETTCERYLEEVRSAGTLWPGDLLQRLYHAIEGEPFHVVIPTGVAFRHLGTTRQLIEEGDAPIEPWSDAATRERSVASTEVATVSSRVVDAGSITGSPGWIEGCDVRAPLILDGENLVAGVDVTRPVQLQRGECVDVIPARSRFGREVFLVRCYKADDLFLGRSERSATFCGIPLTHWLHAASADESDIWGGLDAADRSDWTARLFPAVDRHEDWPDWLWMLDPQRATADDHKRWRSADRYSLAEMNQFADRAACSDRRLRLRSQRLLDSPPGPFESDDETSAEELAMALSHHADPANAMSRILDDAITLPTRTNAPSTRFACPRALHSLGTALDLFAARGHDEQNIAADWWTNHGTPTLTKGIPTDDPITDANSPHAPGSWLRSVAMQVSRRTILNAAPPPLPLRNEPARMKIAESWAPVRMDLCGGWTDTPPFALEHGGCVINAAIDLEGRPPLHVTVKPLEERVLRILSIDQQGRVEIRDAELLKRWSNDLTSAALVRAAVAQTMRHTQSRPGDVAGQATPATMFDVLGGGLEVVTSASVPLGSGLGTSSILGAAVLAALHRTLGRNPTHAELHRETLRLEQSLTTGGGWQDQVGGVEPGVKQVGTAPGLSPEFEIAPIPDDLIAPEKNGGRTLLYYTGLTRLAKNILERIVGRYLDRHRATMATLRGIARLPPAMKKAMESGDIESFGRLIGDAWRLNRQLDPESSTPQIDHLLEKLAPHLFGAKLAGAGGGGFLFLVCRSPESAAAVRDFLTATPLNPRARLFDYRINKAGLVVTGS